MIRHAMTGWYDPPMLVRTGLRVLVSTLFGEFADRRIAIAASSEIAPQPFDTQLDYAEKWDGNDFWFDFLADTGDGWSSTFAIARLLARDDLTFAGAQSLSRGRLVVMGGDQIYPVASMKAYREKLIEPFDEAAKTEGGDWRWPRSERPDLFAIPGNHDWYDGLSSFLALFCRRRVKSSAGFGAASEGKIIGGRETRQTRSYFALKLPGNWWLWATDSQLAGYIDQPQLDYFRHAASEWMAPGSQVILCTGTPDWEYADPSRVPQTFDKFSYLERFAGLAVDATGKPMGHRLRLALSGDSHHYAHFTEDDRHYVTCGGGGAFLHPTHHLGDRQFDSNWPKPGVPPPPHREKGTFSRDFQLGAVFPDKAISRRLTWANLLFAFRNPGYVLFLAMAYGLFLWMLEARGANGTLLNQLHGLSTIDGVTRLWAMILSAPGPTLLLALSFAGYFYFADAHSLTGRAAMGVVHGAAQTSVATLAVVCVFRFWPWDGAAFALIAATLAASIASATCFGAYLLVALNGLRRHWNEAFSALRNRHYKAFLRLRIRADGKLDVFPIGLSRVPRSGKGDRPDLMPHLIEPGFTL